MNKHELADWTVEIEDYAEMDKGSDGCEAYCSTSAKLIKLGYINLKFMKSRQRRNLYLHEIAHALVFLRHGDFQHREYKSGWKKGMLYRSWIPAHGKIWKDIARSIGCRDYRLQ